MPLLRLRLGLRLRWLRREPRCAGSGRCPRRRHQPAHRQRRAGRPRAGRPDAKVKWRQGRLPAGVIAPDDITTFEPTFNQNGFTAELDSLGPNTGILEPADHPLDLPSLVASKVKLDDFSQGENRKLAPGIDGSNTVIVPVGSPTLLPRVLDTGEIVDLQYSLRASQTPLPSLRTYVWLGSKAPADATARLAKVGLTVVSTESVAARTQQLDRQGTALALGIFLIAALAAVILAGGALLTTTTAAARRRSYELAALRVLGAKDRMLVAAGRRELLALTVVGTVIGVACGLVGARLAIPAIPAVDGSGVLVHSNRGPVWSAVLAVAAARARRRAGSSRRSRPAAPSDWPGSTG